MEQNGDLSSAARALTNLAIVQYQAGRVEAAESTYSRSNLHYHELGVHRFVHGYALNQGGMARVAQLQNNHTLALSRFAAAYGTFMDLGDQNSLVNVLLNQSSSQIALGQKGKAASSLQQALSTVEKFGSEQRCNDTILHTAEFLLTTKPSQIACPLCRAAPSQ